MSQIFNKSKHPVNIKKISVRVWTIRDEIEGAIARRIKECEAAGIALYIDDIKDYYRLNMNQPLNKQAQLEEGSVTSLMEEVSEETKQEEVSSLDQAEKTIQEQNKDGVENKPNPILDRPFQRCPPDLNKISYGFCFLSDINMDSLLAFTQNHYIQGNMVMIEFLVPQPFILTAEIMYCHHYAMRSKIISETKPNFRIQAEFKYLISGERDTIRNFLKSIEPDLPKDKKKNTSTTDDALETSADT